MRPKKINKTRHNVSVNNATAQTSEDQTTSGPESKRSRVAVKTERGPQQESSEASGTGKDWRQISAVLESICDHLPFKDLKTVRMVSKDWAIAGAVALSHKCVVTRGYRGLSLEEIEKHVNLFQRNPVLKTGFRLRHVRLEFKFKFYMMKNDFSKATYSLLESWLALFRSEEFKLVTWLRIDKCPSQIVAKFFLPDVLPKYWKNLKSLFFGYWNGYMNLIPEIVATPLEDSEKLSNFPNLELEEFEIHVDIDSKVHYNWEFLKKCSKLKKLKLVVEDYTDRKEFSQYNWDVKLERQRSIYNCISDALQGKELTSLNLRFRVDQVLVQNGINPVAAEMMSCVDRLIIMNQETLEDLKIWFETLPYPYPQLWFQNFPLALQLQRLKRLKVECKGVNVEANDAERLSPFYEALSVFRIKGYLKIENFILNVYDEDHHAPDQIFTIIRFASEKSTRFAIRFIGDMGDLKIHLPPGFGDMISESFPATNYLCMPKCFTRRDSPHVTRTALFEKLGRSGVFNVPSVFEQWKSLKAPVNTAHQHFWNSCFLARVRYETIYDPLPAAFNTLTSVELDWADDWPTTEDSIDSPLFVFDTVPDLEEAWGKVKTSKCCWSTVEEDDMVPNDQAPAVFCRMFEDDEQLSD